MLTDWLHWLTTLRFDELAVILGVLLFVDSTRYVYGTLCMAAVDVVRGLSNWLRGVRPATEYSQCPTVCVLLVGHNEGDTIADALESMWGRYPRLELIVVSDGSTDGMVEIAQQFAAEHAGVLVLSREERGGKSSALNWGLRYTRAEIVVCMDCDSRFSDNALWEIVQPFADPQVGAVSATVEAGMRFITFARGYKLMSIGRRFSWDGKWPIGSTLWRLSQVHSELFVASCSNESAAGMSVQAKMGTSRCAFDGLVIASRRHPKQAA